MTRSSYILWFTQRVGSTLLAQALEDTGALGRPREWLHASSVDELLARHAARDVSELREALWQQGTTNGVFAVKYGMTEAGHAELTALFHGLVDHGASERAAWDAMFPACRHLHLTRRDRLRLAISWWRAIQSGEWHRPRRGDTAVGPAGPPPRESRYDADAIAQLLAEVDERETAIEATLRRWEVPWHTVVYEDLVAAYEPTLREVLRFLDAPPSTPLSEPAFTRLADEVSDDWYARFIRERGYDGGSGARRPITAR